VLAEGQAPRAVILSCADSRVSPEWIFDAAPSGLFVIRSAGNTAFADAVASL
jgi:carbonic anhydrase